MAYFMRHGLSCSNILGFSVKKVEDAEAEFPLAYGDHPLMNAGALRSQAICEIVTAEILERAEGTRPLVFSPSW